jgi:hypothetical protein
MVFMPAPSENPDVLNPHLNSRGLLEYRVHYAGMGGLHHAERRKEGLPETELWASFHDLRHPVKADDMVGLHVLCPTLSGCMGPDRMAGKDTGYRVRVDHAEHVLHGATLPHGPAKDNVARDDIPAFDKIGPEREDNFPCGWLAGQRADDEIIRSPAYICPWPGGCTRGSRSHGAPIKRAVIV